MYISLEEKQNNDLHFNCGVFDAHCDTVQFFTGERGAYHFLRANKQAHVDLPRLNAGGVRVQVFALFIEPRFNSGGALKRCLQLLDAYYQTVRCCQEELVTVTDHRKLQEVLQAGKIAGVLFIEGGEALEKELAVLRLLNRLGVKGLGLTWNRENLLAGAAMEGPDACGLKSFGRGVVREMNNLGMIVDLAHISPRGFMDVLEITAKPVIVSHANARAICDHPRNLSDEQMKALRDNKGVLGLSFYPPFIDHTRADLSRLLDHFEHAVDIMGIDHVGIGSDFDGIDAVVEEISNVSLLPRLTTGLKERGFTEDGIRKILLENFLRIVKETAAAGGDDEVC